MRKLVNLFETILSAPVVVYETSRAGGDYGVSVASEYSVGELLLKFILLVVCNFL